MSVLPGNPSRAAPAPWGRCPFLALTLALAVAVPARAAVPDAPADRARVVGTPATLLVHPATITLDGPRATHQLVVTGQYGDGSVRDLTPFCEFGVEGGAVLDIAPGGFLRPRQDGSCTLLVKAGGQ